MHPDTQSAARADHSRCTGRFPRRALLECGGLTPLLRAQPCRPNSPRSDFSIKPHPHFFLSLLCVLRASARAFPAFFSFSRLRFFRILCALCVSVAIPSFSLAQQPKLNIAAASDLKFALTELASAFEKQSAAKLNLTFGSSGNFFSQIKNGAPFDVFFSADTEFPRRLDTAGLVVSNSTYEYAVGRLVLWVPPGSKIDLSKSGMNSLLDPSVQKIAIANPDHAPYGRAA